MKKINDVSRLYQTTKLAKVDTGEREIINAFYVVPTLHCLIVQQFQNREIFAVLFISSFKQQCRYPSKFNNKMGTYVLIWSFIEKFKRFLFELFFCFDVNESDNMKTEKIENQPTFEVSTKNPNGQMNELVLHIVLPVESMSLFDMLQQVFSSISSVGDMKFLRK